MTFFPLCIGLSGLQNGSFHIKCSDTSEPNNDLPLTHLAEVTLPQDKLNIPRQDGEEIRRNTAAQGEGQTLRKRGNVLSDPNNQLSLGPHDQAHENPPPGKQNDQNEQKRGQNKRNEQGRRSFGTWSQRCALAMIVLLMVWVFLVLRCEFDPGLN